MIMSRWKRLEDRERALVLAGALILALALAWVWIWEPLTRARETQAARIAQHKSLLAWIEAAEPLATRLRQMQPPQGIADGRSLIGLVDQTARAAGLAGSLQRIEPAGENEVQVWLEGAEFPALMNWLVVLGARHAIGADPFHAERSDQASGRVRARLTLVQRSP